MLLLNLGGPDSLPAVERFLRNLFSDREIIQLPGGPWLQKALARLIVRVRLGKVKAAYRSIGGGSPLLELTRRQARALELALNADGRGGFHTGIAMRYWKPASDDALQEMKAAGVRRIVALTLYPQYSEATTGSSLKELARAAARVGGFRVEYPVAGQDGFESRMMKFGSGSERGPAHGIGPGSEHGRASWIGPGSGIVSGSGRADPIPIVAIDRYADDPLYLEALAGTIVEGLEAFPAHGRDRVMILFSAHGLPVRFIERGDPYVDEIGRTRDGVLRILERRGITNDWKQGFQSRTGPVRWIAPYTDRVIEELARDGVTSILVVPIAFVSDHIETLYEVDQLFGGIARRAGIRDFRRVRMLNDDPRFIEALAGLVRRRCEHP